MTPRADRPPAAAHDTLEAIQSPAGDGAFAPHLATTASGGVVMSWLEPVGGSDRIAVRMAEFGGGRWSAARTIVERNDLFANWADFPSVVEDRNGTLFAHWLQKSGSETYAYDVRMSVSKDRGATWSEPFLLNRDGTKTEHGFVSLSPLAGGGVAATWLDGRRMTPGAHEHDAGDMTIRYASVGASGALRDDVELDGRTCECCATGMSVTTTGPVIVYRDRSADEIRDISYVAKTGSGWSQPRPLRADGWKIGGCPVNGPQIDAIGARAAAAWFTAANGQQRVFVAFSDDGGVTFGDAVRVDDEKPIGRVDLAMLDEATALVVWLEQSASSAEIRARRVRRDRSRGQSVRIAESTAARGAGFPRMTKAGGDIWFAWTDASTKTKAVRVARQNVSAMAP